MTIPVQAVSAIVRNTCLSKEEIFELMCEWCFEMGWPDVTEEELQVMWSERKGRVN